MGRSLLLASLTTAAALAFGLLMGLLLGKTDLPFRNVFAVVMTFPFLLPPYVLAVSWAGVPGADGWLFGLGGCVFVLSSAFMPIVMLLTMAALAGVNPRMEEAARLSAGWPRAIGGVRSFIRSLAHDPILELAFAEITTEPQQFVSRTTVRTHPNAREQAARGE